MTEYKRKKLNLAVKRNFQRWLLLRISGTVILCVAVAAVVLYFYSRRELGESFYTAHITVRRVSDLLLPVILAGSAVSLISGLVLALFLPQKIAGPLFHIEKDLNRVGEGDLTVTINLRGKDPLQEFVEAINEDIDGLRGRVEQVQLGFKDLDQSKFSESQKEASLVLSRFKV